MTKLTTAQKLLLLLVVWFLLNGGIGGGAPAPIPEPGFRVLVTYQDATRERLPAGQKALLDSPTLRTYLDKHCVADPKTGPEWRIWKDDTDPKNESAIWQKLMPFAKGKGAWIVAGDGKRGINESLPADEAALMAKLSPIGGGP